MSKQITAVLLTFSKNVSENRYFEALHWAGNTRHLKVSEYEAGANPIGSISRSGESLAAGHRFGQVRTAGLFNALY
jgi:hypothetical protein